MSQSNIRNNSWQTPWAQPSPLATWKSREARPRRARWLRILFLILKASQTVKFWKRLYFNLLAEEPIVVENRREMAKAPCAWKNFYA